MVERLQLQCANDAITRVAAALLMLALASCGRGDDAVPAAAAASETASAAVASNIPIPAAHRIGALEIDNVLAPAPVIAGDSASPIAVYFLVMNTGARSDTLDAVEISGGRAAIHDQVPAANGRTSMVQIPTASIPAGEMLRFIPGGRHVMVEGFTRRISPGDTLPLTLVFRHAGRADVRARVVAYRDLEAAVASGADAHAGH